MRPALRLRASACGRVAGGSVDCGDGEDAGKDVWFIISLVAPRIRAWPLPESLLGTETLRPIP